MRLLVHVDGREGERDDDLAPHHHHHEPTYVSFFRPEGWTWYNAKRARDHLDNGNSTMAVHCSKNSRSNLPHQNGKVQRFADKRHAIMSRFILPHLSVVWDGKNPRMDVVDVANFSSRNRDGAITFRRPRQKRKRIKFQVHSEDLRTDMSRQILCRRNLNKQRVIYWIYTVEVARKSRLSFRVVFAESRLLDELLKFHTRSSS